MSPNHDTNRTHHVEALRRLFSSDEIERMESARRSISIDSATVAYCVYENPFARSGGIYAVADNYSVALRDAGRDVVVLSPFHRAVRTAPPMEELSQVGECEVAFGGESVGVRLLEHRRNDVRWILLEADGFFDASGGPNGTDPYVHDDSSKLLVDSLFACAALPAATAALGVRENVIFHVQDWELASTALTVKEAILRGVLESAAVVLTSHNPYDHALDSDALRLITDRTWSAGDSLSTVYQHMIPLTDAPVSTVSRVFAQELTSDALQTVHFADHLQQTLGDHGVVGVNNGLFGEPRQAFSQAALDAVADGDPERILNEKSALRRAMLEELDAYRDERILGRLDGGAGRPLAELSDEMPVFMMFGRLDPGQKGFDVLARAIERMPRGRARFVLAAVVGSGTQAFVDDLAAVASERSGEVAVYPFRMERGYLEAMAGATFAVMPSLYEPFGGATEPYLQGTPVVARATGGLVQQVTDIDIDPEQATGILFREQPPQSSEEWIHVENSHTPDERKAVPVYDSMVGALVLALNRADELYRHDRLNYGRMLSRLSARAQTFSWERTVQEYSALYEEAAS